MIITPDYEKYFSKLLLFGEYSVINGSMGLIAPVRNYWGRLRGYDRGEDQKADKSRLSLAALYEYLKVNGFDEALDLDRFEDELDQGLFFDSSIPVSYGVGSSGALCAAVVDRYKTGSLNEDIKALKELFSRMESFFHGRSSGVDPLCSYARKPLLIDPDGNISVSELPRLPKDSVFRFYLVDSGVSSDTGPLVNNYLEKMKSPSYSDIISKRFIPVVNSCINYYLAGDLEKLYREMLELSSLQLELFSDMIPDEFIRHWPQNSGRDFYRMKICGSGGGGFIIAFTDNMERFKEYAREQNLKIISPRLVG